MQRRPVKERDVSRLASREVSTLASTEVSRLSSREVTGLLSRDMARQDKDKVYRLSIKYSPNATLIFRG